MTSLNQTKKHIPLIERCLVIGTLQRDLNNMNITYNNIINGNIKTLPIKILENFKSNYCNEEDDLNNINNFIKGIIPFCYPNNLEIKSGHYINEHKIISFTVKYGIERKLISILYFYENYVIDNISFSLPKIICLISKFEILDTCKMILENLFHIFFSKNDQQKFYYFQNLQTKNCKNKYFITQDKEIMEFYMSFILNILPYQQEYNHILVNYLNNNFAKTTFLTYHVESQNSIPIKDFNLFILFQKFNIEDLIHIYLSILIGNKIIIVFENYEEINQILLSLISIIYPLNWKKFPFITYITSDMIEILDSPISIIMGIHIKYLDLLKQKIQIGEIQNDTIVYNIVDKSYIFSISKSIDLTSDMKSSIIKDIYDLIYEYSIKFEKINKNEYFNLFKETIFLLDYKIYFNLKIIYLFFRYFLGIIKNIDLCIQKYDKKKNKNKKSKIVLNNYFNFEKFKNDSRNEKNPKFKQFMYHFSNSMIFNEFISKYIFSQDNIKYSSISNYIEIINKNPLTYNLILSQKFIINIKKNVISSYNFSIISMNKAFETYYNLLDKLCSNKDRPKNKYLIWNPLEIYKVMISYNSIENYLVTKPKEEKYEQLKKELNLLSKNDIIDSDEEDHIVIKPINSQSQYIFNFFRNKINKSATKNIIKNKIISPSLKEKKSSCPNLTEQILKFNKNMNKTDRKSSCINLEISIEESTLYNTIKSKKSNKRLKTNNDSNYIQKLMGDDNNTIFSDDDIVI